jgi:hypothetical protein
MAGILANLSLKDHIKLYLSDPDPEIKKAFQYFGKCKLDNSLSFQETALDLQRVL